MTLCHLNHIRIHNVAGADVAGRTTLLRCTLRRVHSRCHCSMHYHRTGDRDAWSCRRSNPLCFHAPQHFVCTNEV